MGIHFPYLCGKPKKRKVMKIKFIAAFISVLFLASCGSETATEVSSEKTEIHSGEATAKLTIEGMECEINCVAKVQSALEGVEGVSSVVIDFDSEREKDFAQVTYDAGKVSSEDLKNVITELEYKVGEVTVDVEETDTDETSLVVDDMTTPQTYFIPSIFELLVNIL